MGHQDLANRKAQAQVGVGHDASGKPWNTVRRRGLALRAGEGALADRPQRRRPVQVVAGGAFDEHAALQPVAVGLRENSRTTGSRPWGGARSGGARRSEAVRAPAPSRGRGPARPARWDAGPLRRRERRRRRSLQRELGAPGRARETESLVTLGRDVLAFRRVRGKPITCCAYRRISGWEAKRSVQSHSCWSSSLNPYEYSMLSMSQRAPTTITSHCADSAEEGEESIILNFDQAKEAAEARAASTPVQDVVERPSRWPVQTTAAPAAAWLR